MDPTSFLCISNAVFNVSGSGIVIRWPSVADRVYALQAGSNMAEGFTLNLRTNILATPPVNVYTDAVGGVRTRSYRVRVE